MSLLGLSQKSRCIRHPTILVASKDGDWLGDSLIPMGGLAFGEGPVRVRFRSCYIHFTNDGLDVDRERINSGDQYFTSYAVFYVVEPEGFIINVKKFEIPSWLPEKANTKPFDIDYYHSKPKRVGTFGYVEPAAVEVAA